MTYDEAISYLYDRLPMFSRSGAAALKADLVNTKTICTELGNPQEKFRSIHIAGTNGKGSCSHMIAAILQEAGYKTGLYTSPHLRDFRERIRINGEMISKSFVANFTESVRPLITRISPSFFEITVGMAFAYFAEEKVDIAVIETGLGGRLDSTNIIHPVLSVITNVGMDHMNILGDSIEMIAREKAGIIKKDTPVVIGETSPDTEDIFNSVAGDMGAPITFADKKRYTENWRHDGNFLVTDLVDREHDHRITCTLDLPGYYQLKNLVTVAEAICRLKGIVPEPSHIAAALRKVRQLTGLHGRWEIIHQHPQVVLDVAHNEPGIAELLKQVELSDFHKLHIVIGLVRDKAIENILAMLPRTALYYFTQAQIPRALPAGEMRERAEAAGIAGAAYDDVNTALHHALSAADKNDLVLVCGSVFIVGEVLPIH